MVKMKKISLFIICIIALMLIIPYASATAKASVRMIVKTDNSDKIISNTGINPDTTNENLGFVAGNFSAEELAKLSKEVNIKIFEDKEVHLDLTQGVQLIQSQPLTPYKNNFFGKDIKVCIVDTGIDDTHPYLKLLPSDHKKDFTGGGSVIDGHGHGTHVAGIVTADYSRTSKIIGKTKLQGVAPGVDLYVAKALTDEGRGYMSWIMDAIDWCVNEKGADIVSLSLSSDATYTETELCNLEPDCIFINSLVEENDIFIVASSGNTGEYDLGIPACCDEVISVGSITKDKQLSYFSSMHETLDFVAPGSNILSTFPRSRLVSMSGTSMATPFVSGYLALLKSINPSMPNQEILEIAKINAEDLGLLKEEQGNGLINAFDSCVAMFPGAIGLTDCSNTKYSGIQVNSRNALVVDTYAWINLPQFIEGSTLVPENYYYRYKTVSTSKRSGSVSVSLGKSMSLDYSDYIGEILENNLAVHKLSNGDYELYLYDESSKNTQGDYTKYYIFKQIDYSTSKLSSMTKIINTDISNGDFNSFYTVPRGNEENLAPSYCTTLFSIEYQESTCRL